MPNRIKTCQCCGFTTSWLRKRICPSCGVPAIWVTRQLTVEGITAREALEAQREAIVAALLAGQYDT